MKVLTILSIFVVIVLNIASTSANAQTSLLQCQNVESDIERLQCFDNMTKEKLIDTKSNLSIKNEVLTIVERPSQLAEVVAKTNQAPSDFGLEQANQDETVESFIVGEFKGWKKGLIMKLKNGQVWKVTNARSNYTKKQDPAITISRGIMGSFNAKIKDMKTTAKVRRVK